MKKTISVTLGGMIFYIEEDAYNQLNDYLNSLKQHFASYADHQEILSDMEARMAEQFAARANPQAAVTTEEVSSLIVHMGTVADIASDESQDRSDQNGKQPNNKKLYRNTDDAFIAGVCSGLAAYFGIDPVIVRLIFGLSILIGGYSILLYIVLWIIMPEAKTTTEKMQMRGEPITVSSVDESVKKETTADRLKEGANHAVDAVKTSGTKLGRALPKLGSAAIRLIGAFLTLVSVVVLFGATLAFALGVFNVHSPYIDIPLGQLLEGTPYYAALVTGYAALIIPAILVLLIGLSLARRKRILNGTLTAGLLVVWGIVIITGIVLGSRLAPVIKERVDTNPEFRMSTLQAPNTDFNQIVARGSTRVRLHQGSEYAITITGRQKYLDTIKIEQDNQTIYIERRDSNHICIFCFDNNPTVDITLPTLTGISVEGASVVYSEDTFSANNFSITETGSSRAELKLIVQSSLEATLRGASSLGLEGQGTTAMIKASGSSDIQADTFTVHAATLELSGASHARVHPLEILSVSATGSSSVNYYGSPQIQQDLSGDSVVHQIDFEPIIPPKF